MDQGVLRKKNGDKIMDIWIAHDLGSEIIPLVALDDGARGT